MNHGDKIKYDLYYIENQSFLLDIKIIWLTFWQVIAGKGSV
ncbi:MAG: sugar transferase [Macrococcus canis]|nr:sugar transferase [Macrococcus canis]MEE1107593.1 sugar transferase [Macrococcus canis]